MDFIKKTTVVLCLLTCNTILHAQHTYKLVWSDEFNKDSVQDASKWNYEKSFVRNEDHQWYQPENAFCKNGLLQERNKIYNVSCFH